MAAPPWGVKERRAKGATNGDTYASTPPLLLLLLLISTPTAEIRNKLLECFIFGNREVTLEVKLFFLSSRNCGDERREVSQFAELYHRRSIRSRQQNAADEISAPKKKILKRALMHDM